MNTLKFFFLSLLILLISCEGNQPTPILKEDLVGVWRSDTFTASDLQGNLLQVWNETHQIMGLGDNNSYFRTYISGTWQLNGGLIEFSSNASLNIPMQRFKVNSVTENTLEMEIQLTAKEVGVDSTIAQPDDLIVFKEDYVREE